jgi:hypothetical protein
MAIVVLHGFYSKQQALATDTYNIYISLTGGRVAVTEAQPEPHSEYKGWWEDATYVGRVVRHVERVYILRHGKEVFRLEDFPEFPVESGRVWQVKGGQIWQVDSRLKRRRDLELQIARASNE